MAINVDIQLFHAAVTEFRKEHGLPPQELSKVYCDTAQLWADQMANSGKFRHGGGEEIIAWHSDPTVELKAGLEIWKKSPPHRAWLLSKGPLCGFGIACAFEESKMPGTFWVGEFTGVESNPPSVLPVTIGKWKWFLWKGLRLRVSVP